jgi:hypothetical protein
MICKKCCLSFVPALFFITVFGQDDPGMELITTQLEKFRKNFPQEKIHLHFDKPYYAVGDTIYFAGYVVNAERNTPSVTSNILYVDLINDSNKVIEKLFDKDSLAYYEVVLEEADETTELNFEPESFKSIAKVTDSNTVIFHFNNDLQIIYAKEKEPEESLQYRRSQYLKKNIITKNDINAISLGYPSTTLTLLEGIPIEIFENGYFTNIDLFMNGFWGWWEKMAVTLPYEYEP